MTPKKRRRRNRVRNWKPRLLQELASWGNVSRACRLTKVERNTVYEACKSDARDSRRHVLVGKRKAGKSTLARSLAKAVAHGENFLGRKVRQGPVLYVALEEKRSEVRAHFRMLGTASDATLKVFVGTSPTDGLAQLAAALEREPAALVAIDPLFRLIRPRDGNDYAAMTAALDPVLALARHSGACVLVTHHAPKGERADIDAPIGSTAIAGSADVVMVLKRSERYRTLSTVQRTGKDMPDTVIELDPATRAVRASGTRHDADVMATKTAILDYLKTLSEPIDEKVIHESVEGRKKVKTPALRALVEDGSVARTGAGKKGDPYLYSISGFLVPGICWEPENQNSKSTEKPQQSSLFSGFRDSAENVSGSRGTADLDEGVIP